MHRRETRETEPERAPSDTRSVTREAGDPLAVCLGSHSSLGPRSAVRAFSGGGGDAIARAVQASPERRKAASARATSFAAIQTSAHHGTSGTEMPSATREAGDPLALDLRSAVTAVSGGSDEVITKAVQASPERGQAAPTTSYAAIHASARHGTSGTERALPHLSAIQRSFGPEHNVSNIRAYVGGPAAKASAAMGAAAYAYGDRVAFGSAPSLHVAAHEAAHVVQQRRGLSLPGGVGRAGDHYERQADQVAARVVQGRSAASLLSGPGGGETYAKSVQRSPIVQRLEVGDRPYKGGYAPLTRDPAWLGKAEAYEKRLGVYAYNHPKAKAALSSALMKMEDVISREYKVGELEDDARRDLYRQVFTKDDSSSAGQVGSGLSYDDITDLLVNGNLRERMTAFYNAAYYNSDPSKPPLAGLKAIAVDLLLLSEHSKKDLETWSSYMSSMIFRGDTKKTWKELVAEKKAKALALGLDADDIEKKLSFLHSSWLRYGVKLATSKSSIGYNFSDDPFALGNLTLEKETGGTGEMAVSQVGRVKRSAPDQDAEKRTAQDYEDLGIGLSDREKRYAKSKMGVGDDVFDTTKLPWVEGHTYYSMSDSNPWVKRIRGTKRMPVVAGVSGTTTRMLTAFKWLSTGASALDFRLAILGWMLPAWDHSLYEILRGSHLASVKGSDEGNLTDVVSMYMNVPPLTTEELRTHVAHDKLFPHEEIYLSQVEPDKSQSTGYKALFGDSKYDTDPTISGDPKVSRAHATAIYGYTSGIHGLMNAILSSSSDPTGVVGAKLVVSKLKENASLVCREIYLDAKSKSGVALDGTEQADYDYIMGADVELINVLEKEDKFTEWSARCGDLSLSYDDVKAYIKNTVYPWISAMQNPLYEELLVHINMTVEGLSQLPAVTGVDVYRGDWSSVISSRYKEGATITFPEFNSFSRDRDTALDFATGGSLSNPVLLTIALKGKGGRDVSAFSEYDTEAEVLMMPGSKVKINKVTWGTTASGKALKEAEGEEV